jgi:hypothetical protein
MACQIALRAVRDWFDNNQSKPLKDVSFCTFTVRDEIIYEENMPLYF